MSAGTAVRLDIKKLWKAANEKRGCLAHLKTTTGHRRYTNDEDPFTVNDPFVSDAAKLQMSKTFRIQADRTQVFTDPRNALIRTRLSHVLEVDAISIIASDMLGLNTNLVHAGALGHDVGHGPFGHQGEAWMQQAMRRPEFCHEIMGPIIAQKIERKGDGLNLTWETLQVMMCHSGSTIREDSLPEAWLLRYTDKIAYLFADYNDITERMHYPVPQEVVELANAFGHNQRTRSTTAMAGLILESAAAGDKVRFEESNLAKKFHRFRKLMYEIYPKVTQQHVERILEPILEFLEDQKFHDPFLLLTLMTDKDIKHLRSVPMMDANVLINQTAVGEIIQYLDRIGPVDLCNPDLDW